MFGAFYPERLDPFEPMPDPISFVGFVVSLAHTAYVHFGDVPDPASGTAERNLVGAQQIIDILTLIEEKTRGNLTVEERQVIEQALYELRLRFLQVSEDAPRIIHP